MKIEFKHKKDLQGDWYYTEVNGQIVIGSFKSDKDAAYDLFLKIVEFEGKVEKVETLETINK